MSREDRLRAFVEASQDTPFQWGVDDCTLWPAVWVEGELSRTLTKGEYSSKFGALKHIAKSGGIANIWREQLSQIGIFESAGAPKLGDVGLVDTDNFGIIGAILTPSAAICRSENGYRYLPIWSVLNVWSIPDVKTS